MDGWYTREDVKKDLAANGLGANINDDDDSYIISGARPPPPPRHLIEEDDEMEQYILHGTYASGDRRSRRSGKPDLEGISVMLRMVDEHSNGRVKKPEETRIVISKLNPHVPEFKPKQDVNANNTSTNEINTSTESDEKKEENDASKDHNICEKKETYIKKVETNKETRHIHCDVNDDEKKLEAVLKEKIIKTAKAKTIKEKSARNVAIAALLKLKSGSSKSPLTTSSSETQTPRSRSPAPTDAREILVLHPPNFYESKCTDAQADHVISMPDSTESDNSSNEKCQSNKELQKAITSNLEPAEGAIAVVNLPEHESIEKVMNWMNKPKTPSLEPPHIAPINFKKKDPAPLTGPIIYKKKETQESPKSSDSKSPVSDETSKKPSQPGAFVPSKYANDLAKKYEERAKAIEDKQLDMWSKLEKDLKARDEVVKERMKAQNGSSPSTSRGSSRCPSRRQ